MVCFNFDVWSFFLFEWPGSKHKQMIDGHSSQSQCKVKLTSALRPTCRIKQRMGSKTRAVVGANQPFHCEMCQVSVNSETQLKQVCVYVLLILLWPLLYTSFKCKMLSLCWLFSVLIRAPLTETLYPCLLLAHEQQETQRAFSWQACQSEVHSIQ